MVNIAGNTATAPSSMASNARYSAMPAASRTAVGGWWINWSLAAGHASWVIKTLDYFPMTHD
jgi:hypothetical protein